MLLLLLTLVGLVLFCAPHRRLAAPSARRSLAGLARDFVRGTGHGERHPVALLLFGGLACGSVFLPAVLLALVRLCPAAASRWLFGGAAVLLLVAALATWLLVTLSRATFGFGPGSARDATVVASLIPLFLAGTTLAAVAGAASADCAEWLCTV